MAQSQTYVAMTAQDPLNIAGMQTSTASPRAADLMSNVGQAEWWLWRLSVAAVNLGGFDHGVDDLTDTPRRLIEVGAAGVEPGDDSLSSERRQ
jgi:hypothetical protein